MMKKPFAKITSFLLVLIMIIGVIPAVSAAETDTETEEAIYNGTTLVWVNKSIEGVYVVESGTTHIAASAFENCTGLTTVILSEECVSIGDYAFKGCENLEFVRVYDAVAEIGEAPFANCDDYIELVVHYDTFIFQYAKQNKISYSTPYYFGNGIEAIDINSRAMVIGLTDPTIKDLVIPEKIGGGWVKRIIDGAFRNCTNLESVTISEVCDYIGESAFEGCTNLSSVQIDNTQLTIGDNAFKNTAVANNPENNYGGILYISDLIADVDKNIEGTVRILHGTKAIPGEAFKNCKKIEKIIIPQGVEVIGDKAFENCESLRYVKIPKNYLNYHINCFDGTSKDLTICSFYSDVARYFGLNFEQAESYEVYNEEYDITMYFNDDINFKVEEIPVSQYEGINDSFGGTEVKRIVKITFIDPYSGRIINPAQDDFFAIFPLTYDGYFCFNKATADEASSAKYIADAVHDIDRRGNYTELRFFDVDEIVVAEMEFETYCTVDEATGIEFTLPCGYSVEEVIATFRHDDPERFTEYYDYWAPSGEAAVHYKIVEATDDQIGSLPNYWEIKMKVPAISENMLVYSLTRGPETFESKTTDGYVEVYVPYLHLYSWPVVFCTLDEAPVSPESTFDESGSTTDEDETPSSPTDSTDPTTTPTEPDTVVILVGDVNYDGKLNIRDATLIQKYLAKLVEFDYTQKNRLADFNQDFKVNVKDATAIQKKIANII